MTRKTIHTEGYSHSNPVPAACRKGNLMMTGIINGLDPARKGDPGTFEEQCVLMFSRIAPIMAAAGGSLDDIVKLNIAVTDITIRDPINRAWEAMFPHADERPVRQTVVADLDRGKLIQCDLVAWIE